MNTGHDHQKGIFVVSFDGGGPGVVSQLVMMAEFMDRLAYDDNIEESESYPIGCCDLMGGVGFGGLAALLLGRLRMSVEEAMDELITIGKAVFPQSPQDKSREANTGRLRNAIEDMLRRNQHPIDLKLRENAETRCKVVVFAAPEAVKIHCQAFRTYRHRGNGLQCTFVEAACAILASPESFAPVAIGPSSRCQRFVGIPHGYVNPMREVFKEAQRIFGDEKPVSLFLSLGSGQQSPIPIIQTRLTHITYDYGTVEKELSHQLGGAAAYLRLNVDKGLETIETTQWNDVGPIISHTRVYLEIATITNFIDEAVHRVLGETGSITLGELVGGGSSAKIRFDSQELGALLKREFKPMHDILEVISERITLVDATGTRIPIPLQLCVSYEMLAGIIRSYYEHHHPPGTGLVRQGHYQLVCGTEREEVEPSKWSFIATSGMMVEMSMIRHNRHKRDMSCPKCGRISNTRIIDTWATCSPCNVQFRITDITESNDTLISLAVDQSTGHNNENSITDAPIAESRITKKSSRNEVDEMDEWGKFRLITVINLLRNHSRSPIHPVNVIGLPDTFVDIPDHGLLRPEYIQVGPSVSGTTISEMVDNTTTGDRSPNPQETRISYISEGSSSRGSSRTSIDSDEALGLSRGAFVSYPNPSTGNLSMIEEERVRKNIFPPRPPGAQREHDNTSIQDYNNERALWDEISQYSLLSPRKRSQASDSPPQSPVGSPRPGSHPHPRPQRPIPSKVGIPALLGGESPPSSSQAGFAGIGAHGGIHKWALNVGEMNPPMGYNFDHRPITRLSMVGSLSGSDSDNERPPIAPKPHPPSRRKPIILDDPLPDVERYNPGHAATRSTGSLLSVHSSRMRFDPQAYVDPAFEIESDLTVALEQDVEQIRSPSDEGLLQAARSSMGKRVSNVLKFGKKGKRSEDRNS